MAKYKLFILYDERLYEKLVVHVNKYVSKIETEYLGEIVINDENIKDMDRGLGLTPTISRDLFSRIDNNTREQIEKYTVNMYNTMKSMFLYGSNTFNGIETLDIEEEE